MFVYLEIQLQTEESRRFSYLSVSSEEPVGERDAEIEADGFEDVSLHCEQLRLLIGVVTDVQEVVQTWRHALLKSRKHFIFNPLMLTAAKTGLTILIKNF